MGVPAEEDAIPDRFDVHVGGADRGPVIRGVFNDLLMEPAILLPTGNGEELVKVVGKLGGVKVASNEFSRIGVLFFLPKLFTDKELEEFDFGIHSQKLR